LEYGLLAVCGILGKQKAALDETILSTSATNQDLYLPYNLIQVYHPVESTVKSYLLWSQYKDEAFIGIISKKSFLPVLPQ
jgi:hypothetical protein